jgi:CheY-like chemotaxis protein
MGFTEAPGAMDVLIADDDSALRAVLRTLLELEGLTCAEAGDGWEAVEVARSHPPRCVLLDLGMPGLDGFAVARWLRADPRTRGAHVHCLTGHVDPLSRLQAAQAGCELFLTKPVEPSALLQAVRSETAPQRTACISGLTKAEAEELLDLLEAQGLPGEVGLSEAEPGFAVRWPQEAPETKGPLRCRRHHRPPCPSCASTSRPYMKRERMPLSWALVGLGVVIWPLLVVGLLLRRDVWRCWDCHCVLGRGRPTLG